MKILENIVDALIKTTLWEWIAVLAGVLYVLLISYKHISAWFFAIVSSFIYIYLCYISQLYLETGLQFFYLAMGIYGWIVWSKKRNESTDPIIKWPSKKHGLNILLSAILTVIFGFIFDNYTAQENPYTDSFTTVFSLTATYMVTKKVLENWIYWIIIDAASIYLFASREYYLTAVLFLFYTLIAVFGYMKWRKQFQLQVA